MVESIKELKIICARPNQANNVYQKIAPYFTKLLLFLRLSANQVSIIGFEFGVIASIFFMHDDPLYYTIGGIFLFFVMLWDCCDGKIARYYGTDKSGLGGFFDWFTHQSKFLVITCLSFGFTSGFPRYSFPLLILFGLISTTFWLLNHTFYGLRKNLFKTNVTDETVKKITYTFENKFAILLLNFVYFAMKILQKYKITYADFDQVPNKNKLLYKARLFIRKTQNGKILPFIFIFSGIIDYFFPGPNYITFGAWIYLGTSSVILFVIEEFFTRKLGLLSND